MPLLPFINGSLAVGILFFAVLMFGSFRLLSAARHYAFSSLCLALMTIGLAIGNGLNELYVYAVATIVIKVVLLPTIILSSAERAKIPMRLQSFLRPTPCYFFAMLILLITLLTLRSSPLAQSTLPIYFLYITVSLVLLGFGMMIVRRDLPSQLLAFLLLENGISMFSIATVGSLPMIIEIGIFLAVILSAALMSRLFQHVQHLYGTPDSHFLRELID
jgi:hydrogenase-4 component E